MKQSNSRWAVNLTALVLAAGLLIGLFTGCFQLGSSKPQPNKPGLFETDGNGIITGYTCDKTDLPKALVIPAKIGNEVITGIRNNAFYDCKGLTSLDLSACTSLTVIGVEADTYLRMGAFGGCTGLTEVKLPASLTKIDNSAFRDCTGLTSIDLSGCTSLTKIEEYAFSGCTGLTEVKLPASLTEIGKLAFRGCTRLTSIDLSACTSLTKIGREAFSGCTGLTEVKLPASLTGIGELAFHGCTSLTSIDLSGCTNLTEIGTMAFEGCTGLASIDLSACTSLTEIGERAFKDCSKLTGTIVFPASLKTIKTHNYNNYPDNFVGAFEGCIKLQGADFSACTNFTKIENSTFKNCWRLTEVKLPASLTEIGKEAFKDCVNLTSAVFADKNVWKVYNNYDYSGTPTPISSSDLDNAATAAEYLRQTYVYKFWKKN